MNAYIGAASITDKHGRRMRAFHVVTLETDAYGTERLGWALVPAVDHDDAMRRTLRRWPELSVMSTAEVPI